MGNRHGWTGRSGRSFGDGCAIRASARMRHSIIQQYFSRGAFVRRALLIVAVCVPVFFSAVAHPAAGDCQVMTSSPEAVSVGALELSATIDPGIALTRVTIKLKGAVMGVLNLSYANPAADIKASVDGCTAKGRVALHLVRPPALSTIDGTITLSATDSARAWCLSAADVSQSSNDNTQTFEGTVFHWLGATHLVLQRQQQWILPDLMVQTDVVDTDAEITMYPQGATVTLFYGPQILWSQTVLMGVQIYSIRDISAGSVTLDAGASFALEPATPMQPGQVVGTFTAHNKAFSGEDTQVKFDGVLAKWLWPGRQPTPYQEVFK